MDEQIITELSAAARLPFSVVMFDFCRPTLPNPKNLKVGRRYSASQPPLIALSRQGSASIQGTLEPLRRHCLSTLAQSCRLYAQTGDKDRRNDGSIYFPFPCCTASLIACGTRSESFNSSPQSGLYFAVEFVSANLRNR